MFPRLPSPVSRSPSVVPPSPVPKTHDWRLSTAFGPTQREFDESEFGIEVRGVGGEYCATTGSLVHIAPTNEQSHMLYPSVDLPLSPG